MLLPRAGAWLATLSALAVFGGSAATLTHPPQSADLNPLTSSWLNLYLLLGLLGVLPLVTARRLLLQLRRRHRKALADRDLRVELLESLHEGVLVLEDAPASPMCIIEANQAAESLFGLPRSALIGSRLADHFPGRGTETLAPDLVSSSDGLVVLQGIRADGSTFWSEAAMNRHPVGDQDRLLMSLRVIDDRIRRQADLRRSKVRLESRIAERTRELEKSHEEIRAFSYAVSHDLRAPLRAVHGFAQALSEDYHNQLTALESEGLGTILKESSWMHLEIENLLELSRIERKGLHPEWIDVRELVQSVCEDIANSSPRLVWAARTRLTGDWRHCRFDRTALKSIWTSLIADGMLCHPDKVSPALQIHGEADEKGVWYTLAPVLQHPVAAGDASFKQITPRNALARLLDRVQLEMQVDVSSGGPVVRIRIPNSGTSL
jgi:signal transduction histidine kinase